MDHVLKSWSGFPESFGKHWSSTPDPSCAFNALRDSASAPCSPSEWPAILSFPWMPAPCLLKASANFFHLPARHRLPPPLQRMCFLGLSLGGRYTGQPSWALHYILLWNYTLPMSHICSFWDVRAACTSLFTSLSLGLNMKLATAGAERVKDALSLGGVPGPSREAGGAASLPLGAHHPRSASAFLFALHRHLGHDLIFSKLKRIIFSPSDFVELKRNFLTPVESSKHTFACNFLPIGKYWC